MALRSFRPALRTLVLASVFYCILVESGEDSWVSPSELAQKVENGFASGNDDISLSQHAAQKIRENAIDGRSLEEVFRNGWAAERELVQVLLPASAPWGSQLRLLQFLRDAGRHTTPPWQEPSRSKRETNLKKFLLEDNEYDLHTPPESTQVQLGLNFFKVFGVDLKTSVLTVAVYLRLSWKDPRLAFNSTLWNLTSTSFGIESHSFENTRVWVPDIELYNSEGSVNDLSNKNAQADEDGTIFWSRSGLLGALCVFRGLESFPFDDLRCQLEFGSWAYSDRVVDLIPRRQDGGATWQGSEDSGLGNGDISTITQGTSFQDSTIRDVKVERRVTYYDSSPDTGWPVILFTITLRRARRFYLLALVVPQIVVSGLSWISYFMHPEVGERFGFSITLFLASSTIDIVATSFMPVCAEMLLMNWISLCAAISCIMALVETCVVMYVYHLDLVDAQQLLPRWMRCQRFRSDRSLLSSVVPITEKITEIGDATKYFFSKKPTGEDGDSDEIESVEDPHTKTGCSAANGEQKRNDEPVTHVTHEPVTIPSGISTKSQSSRHPERNHSGQSSKSGVSRSTSGGRSKTKHNKSQKEMAEEKFRELHEAGAHSDVGKLDLRLRRHLYSQAFYILDTDFSGALEFGEIDLFGKFMLGDEWSQDMLNSFMQRADRDGSGGLSLFEFSTFCESAVSATSSCAGQIANSNYIQDMVTCFIEMMDKEGDKNKARWKSIALRIDYTCRHIIPLSTLLLFIYILGTGSTG